MEHTTASTDTIEKNMPDNFSKNELSDLIHACFPVDPMPRTFWIDGIEPLGGDIPQELAQRIAHRPWTKITMLDWTMTGAHATIARAYVEPDAFRYYLPSLLVGGLNDLGYLDWPLECLLPAGRKRRTTGKWWQDFWAGLSGEQKDAIRSYLVGVRSMLSEGVHLSELHFIEEAQVIWVS